MNGRVSTILRKAGKGDKKSKKLYNSLNHAQRGLLLKFYEFAINQGMHVQSSDEV